jgi:hypothetical protein
LGVIGEAIGRFDAQVLAYCQMGNHYHLVMHTGQANLPRAMRHINGVYTQQFNWRHGLVGHVFQGRFQAILVDRDAYLLALCRYVGPLLFTMAIDPLNNQRLYVGTDLGVFVSLNGGATWSRENTGFANVTTYMLKIKGRTLYAFTHGRSAFRVPLDATPSASAKTGR